jgi:hypothetical protein
MTNHDDSRAGRQRRAIDAKTIAEIARLCSRLLTEAESCRRLGVNPATWRNWKSRNRNDEKFAALLEEHRAGRLDLLIEAIENSAVGKNIRQPDWRAAQFLLAVSDRQRFNPSASLELSAVPAQVNVSVIAELSRLVFGVAANEPAKALPAAAETRHGCP